MVNYTAKCYLFEQSAVREFYSGAYYDLFLVMRGSGVFRCSEVVQNCFQELEQTDILRLQVIMERQSILETILTRQIMNHYISLAI